MKKISYEYLLYYLQITFIGVFVLILCAYNIKVEEKDFLKRGMLTKNVQGIQVSSEYLASVKGEVVDLQIPKTTAGDYMIYKRLSEEFNEIVRGIYGTKDVFDYSGYLSKGRFFTESDYENKTPTAVVGSSMIDKVYEKDGKQYFGYNNQLFEVIGIFRETDSDLDNTVYLNLTNLLQNTDNYGLYYVDAQKAEIVNSVIKVMETNAGNSYSTSEVSYQPLNTYTLGETNNMLLLCAVLGAVLNLFISNIFFIAHKKYEVAIQKFCGMTKKDLCLVYGKRIFLVLAAGFLSVYFIIRYLAKYMGYFFALETLKWQHFSVTAILLVIMGGVVTGCIVRQAQQINISESLKGR